MQSPITNGKTHNLIVVTDSSTGDMIIKLVNLLPVEVSTTVDIKDCASYAGQATCTVLSGTPDDRNAVPT